MSYFDCVRQFHKKVLDIEDTKPTLEPPVTLDQRVKFMEEEITELMEAYVANDMVGVADALADLVYVAVGTAYIMGIPFDEVFKVVHAANMQKVRGITKRGMLYDAVKPAGWVGPEAEIKAILDAASKS
jgi:predicted HAD superfamily Cof-like phosphohydrolase